MGKFLVAVAVAAFGFMAAAPVQAVTLTFTIDSVQFYDDNDQLQEPDPSNPMSGTLVGTFSYDSIARIITAADLTVSGLAAEFDAYNQRYTLASGGRNGAQIAPDGATSFEGEEFLRFEFEPALSDLTGIGDQVALSDPLSTRRFYSLMARCASGNGIATRCLTFSPAFVFDGSATLTSIRATPVPLPAGLPLAFGAMAAIWALGRRRRG